MPVYPALYPIPSHAPITPCPFARPSPFDMVIVEEQENERSMKMRENGGGGRGI